VSTLLDTWSCEDKSSTGTELRSRALSTLVELDLWSRQPTIGPAAHRRLDDAVELARLARHCDLLLRALLVRAQVLIVEGRHEAARNVCSEALDIARASSDNYWRMKFLSWMGISANAAGDFVAAIEYASASRDLAREFGDDHQLLMASHVLAGIPGAHNDSRAGVADDDALLALARRLGDNRAEGMILIGAALRSLRTGDVSIVARLVLEALEVARRTGTWYLEEFGLFTLVIALVLAGRTTEAVELHGAIREAVLPAIRARLPAEAVSAYEAALKTASESMSSRTFDRLAATGGLCTWPSALALADKRATELSGSQSPLAVTSDSGKHRTQACRNGDALSPRELEVLRLIASGCSNKDVASTLKLRPKTVMHYASNVYRKLEVRSRAQAVAVAWDRGLLEPTR